jgi:hypothetical protein
MVTGFTAGCAFFVTYVGDGCTVENGTLQQYFYANYIQRIP